MSSSSTSQIDQWLKALGQGGLSVLTVEGPAPNRRALFHQCSAVTVDDWQLGLKQSVLSSTLQAYRPMFSQLLHTDLLLDEPLRGVVDKEFYFISDAFKIFMEARFQVSEGEPEETYVEAINRWVLGQPLESKHEEFFRSAQVYRRVGQEEQLDFIFFLAALSAMSGVVDRLTIAIDNVELAASKSQNALVQEIDDVVFRAYRWEKLGSPLGVLVGTEKVSLLPSRLNRLLKDSVVPV